MKPFALQALLCLILSALLCECSLAVGKITADPNAGGSAASKAPIGGDARLAQKVTYEARYVSVQQILEDLTAMTGIKLYASKYDWPVRNRKMNIFVKDVKMADLMNSVAHVMKFKWSCNNDLTPPTYRLVVDAKAAAAADAQRALVQSKYEEQWQSSRSAWVGAIAKGYSKSDLRLESLKETDPVMYEYGRRGVIEALNALFEEVPETKERYVEGRSFRISTDKLSLSTKSLLYDSGNELSKYLQISAGKEPNGYGNTLKCDDRFDVAFNRLDVGSFTPNLRWGCSSWEDTGYFHISKGVHDLEIAALPSRDSGWARMMSTAHNMILDGDNPDRVWVTLDSSFAKLVGDRKKAAELLYPNEPLNEHPDFPELERAFKLKVDTPKTQQSPALAVNSYIASFQKALADATGLGVVSDSWVSIDGNKLPDQEAKLSELLDKFTAQFSYNWDKSSVILEFRHRKWWKNRLNQIPDEWVTAWSENTEKNGVLSLDDLAQISTLNYDQAEESLKVDKVLGTSGIYGQILGILDANGNLQWLRLYSTLNFQLRTQLMNRWISGAMLSPDQWNMAQVMFDRIGSLRTDALFSLRIVPNKSQLIYEFREFEVAAQRNDDTAKEDRTWRITLPRYVQPAMQGNAAH